MKKLSLLFIGSVLIQVFSTLIYGMEDYAQTIIYAIYKRDNPKVQELAKVAEYLRARSASNDTPLHVAASCGNIAAIPILVKAGINVDEPGSRNQTPLHQAVQNYSATSTELVKTVSTLLTLGANPNQLDIFSNNPLHSVHDEAVARLLAEAHADVNQQNFEGHVPLHYATIRKDKAIMKILIAFGANVNTQNKSGYTPLHWATTTGDHECIEILAAGADAQLRTKKGETAIDRARFDNRTDLAQFIESYIPKKKCLECRTYQTSGGQVIQYKISKKQ